MKKIATWFKCEYPECGRETDRGYEIRRQGKRIKVCETCYQTLKYPIRHKDIKK